MRLSTVRIGDRPCFGVVDGDELHDLGASGRWPDLAAVLAAPPADVAAAAEHAPTVPLTGARFEPPVPGPERILCVGLNYHAHRAESDQGSTAKDHPAIFVRFASSLVGHGQPLVRPRCSTAYDYEGELGVVIGTRCRAVPVADALGAVAGYTIVMEGTLRDYQRHSSQFTAGKTFDRSGAVGPWIATPDEVDLATAVLTTTVNGEERQRAPIADLIHGVAELIAYCSAFTTLEPGDLISTGTPGGVGYARTPPVWLVPGDVVAVSVTGVGTLTNPVVDE
jgi:2-keto-4-pentenoate hydratase/2-oxohepta-3-ene-1,7-dioic acid hydratase in catechol pathway